MLPVVIASSLTLPLLRALEQISLFVCKNKQTVKQQIEAGAVS